MSFPNSFGGKSPTGDRSAEFLALGFDPAPGMVSAADDAAEELRAVSEQLEEARLSLISIGSCDGVWRGKGADAFRGRVGELPEQLDAATESMRTARNALSGWASDLEAFRGEALDLEFRAAAAREQLKQAEHHPGFQEFGRFYSTTVELQAARARLEAAKAQVQAAKASFEEVLAAALRLFERHEQRAGQVARALNAAASSAPDQGFFDKLGELFNAFAELAKDIWQFIQDNAHTIGNIADVISNISTALGVIGLALDATGVGAPAGAIVGGISAGIAAVAAVGHGLAWLGGDESSGESFLWDVAGVATFGIGKGVKAGSDVFGEVAELGWGAGVLGFTQGFQFGRDAEDSSNTTIVDNFKDYWVPKDSDQLKTYGFSPALIAFDNAIRIGQEEDRQARQNR